MVDEVGLWAIVVVPVIGGAAVAVGGRCGRAPRLMAPAALITLAATLALGAWAAAVQPSATWRWGPSLGLSLQVVDFARPMVVLVPAVALAVVGWAAVTTGADAGRARLLGGLVVFVGAMVLLVAAADLLTLLVAWELVAACSWALIAHQWRDAGAPRSAREAFITTRVGDIGLYLAAGAALAGAGSLRYDELAGASRPELQVIAAGVLLAAAAKSAQVPFAPWLFSAMAGPTPVSALLHSATMVASGAYLLIRLAPSVGAVEWFAPAVIGVGLLSALAGAAVAAAQTDFKRALAGSTTAQYGVILVAVGAGATGAAGLQLVAHALFKALLFLGAGVALHAAGSGELSGLRLGHRLPRVALAFAVGAAALAGLPPLGAAFAKEAVTAAAAEWAPWLGGAMLLAGAGSAFYATRLGLLAYGRERRPPRPGEAVTLRPVLGGRSVTGSGDHLPGRELAPLAALAGASVVLGLLWLPGGHSWAESAMAGPLPAAGVGELAVSLLALGIGAGLAVRLDRSRRLVSAGFPARAQRVAAGWFGLPVAGRRLVVDPVLATSRGLARLDDRVIDAGVRGTAGLATLISRGFAGWGELRVDGVVRAVAGGTLAGARSSRRLDEAGVDGAVEGLAQAVGTAGAASRRLQGGLTHRYYLLLAAGLAVGLATAAAWR